MGIVTISDFLHTQAIRRPAHLAYIYPGHAVPWGELNRRVDALAAGIWARGLRTGDVVAIGAHDGPVQIETLFAAARIGATRVGLNYRFARREIERLAKHSGAKLIIVEDDLQHLTGGCSPKFGTITAGDGQTRLGDYENLFDFDAEFTPPPVADTDWAQICYTTGSTGDPKGALWRHSAIVNALGFTLLDYGLTEDDIYLHCLPAAGVPSQLAVWNVVLGFTSVVMRSFDPHLALDLIARHGCSATLWVPTMLTDICAAWEKRPRDVSSMRRILYGAAPTPPALLRRGIKVFAGADFVGTYGSTEGAGGWFTKLSPEDHRRALEGQEELLSSCGRPMIHARLKVVDGQGRSCPTGEIGEVCVSGGFVMEGYFKEEEQTRQTIRDGWLHTGDMGRIDEDGYIYLVDRKQFMIITGGYNVYPIEIENVIAEHPAVREVCVFGVPDTRWGEAIHAAVVLGDGETVGAEEIIIWCRDRLSRFKVPKSVELRASLMRGTTGKLLKRAERDRYLGGKAGDGLADE